MKLGHLEFPKLELEPERLTSPNSFQMRLYLQYSDLIKNTDAGKEISQRIESDPRVKKLDGCMLFNGIGAGPFDSRVLSMWFLWAINEDGKESAENNLNDFLDATDITVLNTLWILGVEVDEPISLPKNMVLVPTSAMPDSNEKEQYLKHQTGFVSQRSPQPSAAITIETKIAKIYNDEDDAEIYKAYWASSELLHEASLALNAISNTSCISYFYTAYLPHGTPIGHFGISYTRLFTTICNI